MKPLYRVRRSGTIHTKTNFEETSQKFIIAHKAAQLKRFNQRWKTAVEDFQIHQFLVSKIEVFSFEKKIHSLTGIYKSLIVISNRCSWRVIKPPWKSAHYSFLTGRHEVDLSIFILTPAWTSLIILSIICKQH